MQTKFPLLLCPLLFLFTVPSPGQNRTSDGVPYVVLQEGAGISPQMGHEVKCHYEVTDANGNILWSTRSLNEPDFIVLGEKQSPVARIRDNCFLVMRQGSRYRFEFPKAMLETPQAVDLPGAHITYDIELIGFGAPTPSGVKLFREIKQQQGVGAAVTRLQGLYASRSNEYVLREAEVNRLGYELLSVKEIDAAIAIFEINIGLYPTSYNAFDSLGDAYVAKGDKIKAKSCFEKALQINPGYDDARQKLRDL